jgi:hypothetical protein
LQVIHVLVDTLKLVLTLPDLVQRLLMLFYEAL